MKCPFCGFTESRVIDSRPADEGATIRRRRECLACTKRFTTYEIIERLPLVVVKRDGSRQTFDKVKLINGMVRACEKRPVSLSSLEQIADEIEQELQSDLEREVSKMCIRDRAYCENGEYDLALEQANLAAGRWDDSYAYAGIFIRHTEIDAVSYALYDLVAALESTEPESAAELYPGLIAHIESLYEVERVSVASVF